LIELDGGESRSEIVVCGVLLVMLRGEGEEEKRVGVVLVVVTKTFSWVI